MKSLLLVALTSSMLMGHLHAGVITGTITNWRESGPVMTIGDGTNHVAMFWSLHSPGGSGYFYGGSIWVPEGNEVSAAPTITDISQIVNAGSMSFTTGSTEYLWDGDYDPDGVGDFVVYRNTDTGHFGVLRMDDVDGYYLNATWWFQTDGSGDFSSAVVPEPSALSLALAGLLVLVLVRVGVPRASAWRLSSRSRNSAVRQ